MANTRFETQGRSTNGKTTPKVRTLGKRLRVIKNKPHITENQPRACQRNIKHKPVLKVKLKGELEKKSICMLRFQS